MKRGDLVLLVLLVSCQPNFQNGKTLCSDKQECPSGFVCGNDGTDNFCFDNKIAGCPSGYFYCASSGVCKVSLTQCSTTSTGSGGSGGSNGCVPTAVTSACSSAASSSTDPCEICLANQCCGPMTACANDTNCNTNYTGSAWNAFTACGSNCCLAACASSGGQGGSSGGTGG